LLKALLVLSLASILFAELKTHKLHSKLSLPIVQGKIKFLDVKEVVFKKNFYELSGIEYDNGRLYGISDKGYIYYMSINIENDRIKSLSLDKTVKLKQGNIKGKIDSEGIILRDDYFYLSFERDPKIGKYSLNGKHIKTQKIDKELKKINNYRGENKGLESIAHSKKYGIITAPEVPLKSTIEYMHALYSKNDTWYFPYKAPLSSMAFMSKNKLLMIQRKYNKETFDAKVYLTQVNLKKCVFGVCRSKILATLQTKDGWNIDNFEGLTQIDKTRFLMISDNNDNPKQKTLLVLFEVLD